MSCSYLLEGVLLGKRDWGCRGGWLLFSVFRKHADRWQQETWLSVNGEPKKKTDATRRRRRKRGGKRKKGKKKCCSSMVLWDGLVPCAAHSAGCISTYGASSIGATTSSSDMINLVLECVNKLTNCKVKKFDRSPRYFLT